MKLSTIKKQAQKITASRGHRMKWGQVLGRAKGPKGQTGTCKCGCEVLLMEKTSRHQIDRGGNALTINCK